MDKIIEELISVCSREVDAFNQLLKTLHQKQRAIVEGEIERLKEHVQTENKIIDQTKMLEGERIGHTQELAKALSLENLNPRLGEIIDLVEEKYAQRLTEQRNLLKSIVERIRNLNQSNQFLLNYSLQFIDNSMRMLFNGQENTLYQQDGKVREESTRPKILDHLI
ncbi:MAG: flagellar protein FlgN [bacterium]